MWDKGFREIEKRLKSHVDKVKLTETEKEIIISRIKRGKKLEDLCDCDLIEEAVPEDLELKKKVLS